MTLLVMIKIGQKHNINADRASIFDMQQKPQL